MRATEFFGLVKREKPLDHPEITHLDTADPFTRKAIIDYRRHISRIGDQPTLWGNPGVVNIGPAGDR